MTSNATSRARVHYATYLDEDTGERTPQFLYSHEEIDAEIEQRIHSDPTRAAQHEATRAKFHAALIADSMRHEAPAAPAKNRSNPLLLEGLRAIPCPGCLTRKASLDITPDGPKGSRMVPQQADPRWQKCAEMR